MKTPASWSNFIIITILGTISFFSLVVAASGKDDPVEAERLCRNEVIQRYKTVRLNVKVVYRGDDGAGHHIANFDVILSDTEVINGICLVRKSDGAIELRELIEFPDKNSRD